MAVVTVNWTIPGVSTFLANNGPHRCKTKQEKQKFNMCTMHDTYTQNTTLTD